jgi:phage-related protein
MAVADQRVAVRNDATGELGHAIRGHIPHGFSEVKHAAEGQAKASHDTMEGKGLVHSGGTSPSHSAPSEHVQAVHSAVGRSSVGKPQDRSAGRMGGTKVDGRET